VTDRRTLRAATIARATGAVNFALGALLLAAVTEAPAIPSDAPATPADAPATPADARATPADARAPAPEAPAIEPPATVTFVDPAARMLSGDGAGEAWDVSARLEGGSHFFVRFWVTNEGPGSHTGVAMGYFVGPNGDVARFRYGRTRDRWQSGAGGRFLRVASAVLDLRAPSGSVEIDTNKGGMKIYLRFDVPDAPPPICAWRDVESGFDVLRLQGDVDGTAWVEGMAKPIAARGAVDVTHAWGGASEIDMALRRIDASGRDGSVAFFATVVTPPGSAAARSCVAVADRGDLIYESHNVAVDDAATSLAGTENDYPLPSRLVFRSEESLLTVEPTRELLRVNPLELVPQPFRTLLAMRSAPRRAWAEGSWQLRLDQKGAALERRGRGVTAVTYTNPP
jgi:hypothetical protein